MVTVGHHDRAPNLSALSQQLAAVTKLGCISLHVALDVAVQRQPVVFDGDRGHRIGALHQFVVAAHRLGVVQAIA